MRQRPLASLRLTAPRGADSAAEGGVRTTYQIENYANVHRAYSRLHNVTPVVVVVVVVVEEEIVVVVVVVVEVVVVVAAAAVVVVVVVVAGVAVVVVVV